MDCVTSILASVFITALKIIVSLLTNSLSLLSEALHSTIGLIAVVTTFFTIRKADSPADSNHLYGHGKAENISSLIETILLFTICGWIVYEAYGRLFIFEAPVDLNIYAALTMLVAIIVDF